MGDALCASPIITNSQRDDFFPEVGLGKPGPAGQAAYDRAKAICALCPVAWDCLREHMHELWGVWGGTDPQERDVVRKAGNGTIVPVAGNPLGRSARGRVDRRAV